MHLSEARCALYHQDAQLTQLNCTGCSEWWIMSHLIAVLAFVYLQAAALISKPRIPMKQFVTYRGGSHLGYTNLASECLSGTNWLLYCHCLSIKLRPCYSGPLIIINTHSLPLISLLLSQSESLMSSAFVAASCAFSQSAADNCSGASSLKLARVCPLKKELNPLADINAAGTLIDTHLLFVQLEHRTRIYRWDKCPVMSATG